jgi:nicotinamide-nucleotide amidase
VILAVGSELLSPHKSDTNSLFLTEQLNAHGVVVRYKLVVGDEEDDLATAIRDAVFRADLVVVTGGLGPTDDDITRMAVGKAFGLTLSEDADVVARIRARFASRGLEMPDLNRRQALVPEGAAILANSRGTAPGLWIERGDVICLLLPGPPRELRPMFAQVLSERIAGRTAGYRLFRRVLTIVGRTESHVEELVQPIYSQWRVPGRRIDTTILASLGQFELHLSTGDDDEGRATRLLDVATNELADVLGDSLVSTHGESLEEVVGHLLINRDQRVALAESCTGGLITSRLTDVPGSSAYVLAGWVVYSNGAKIWLGVDNALIVRYGAVSEPVASALAVQARQRAGADYGLGVTGIAGPGGGSDEKPVGTVWFGLAGVDGRVRTFSARFSGERGRVKFQASQTALDMLRLELLKA